jgi:hypothetical protein
VKFNLGSIIKFTISLALGLGLVWFLNSKISAEQRIQIIEGLKNIQDLYLKIYYPKIKSDDIKNIIDFLNGNKKNELFKSSQIFETINTISSNVIHSK